MKRRGQIFSLDAMIAFVLVILMLGTVTATSEGLRNEITSLVGWYERANIADNMLDVLTKSPGEPANWVDDPSNVRLVGLADNRSGGIAYQKVLKLVEEVENNNPAVKASLAKMCDDKDFELLFFQGKWDFYVGYNWSGENTSLTGQGAYMPLDVQCTVVLHGAQSINPPAPTGDYIGGIVECTPFQVIGAGSLSFSYDYPLCFAGSVIAPGDNQGSIFLSNTQVGSYISIAEDLISEKLGAIHITVTYGSLYIGGVMWLNGFGSERVDAQAIYILGGTGKTPYLSVVSAGAYVHASVAIFFYVDGTWYAVRNFHIGTGYGATDTGDWYKLVNGTWEDASSDVSINLATGDVYINNVHVIHVAMIGGGDIAVDSQGELPTSIDIPPCIAGAEIPIAVDNITANYTFPTNITSGVGAGNINNIPPELYKAIVKINNTITVNPDMAVVMKSRENSPWVEFSERRTTMVRLRYVPEENITSGGLVNLLSGTLVSPIPAYYMLNITLPDQNGIYALFTVVDGSTLKVFSVWRVNDKVGGALWVKNESSIELVQVYKGIGNTLLVPWKDFFGEFNPYKGGKIVSLWMYTSNAPWIFVSDEGGISAFLSPRAEPAVVQLWVWDDS